MWEGYAISNAKWTGVRLRVSQINLLLVVVMFLRLSYFPMSGYSHRFGRGSGRRAHQTRPFGRGGRRSDR